MKEGEREARRIEKERKRETDSERKKQKLWLKISLVASVSLNIYSLAKPYVTEENALDVEYLLKQF